MMQAHALINRAKEAAGYRLANERVLERLEAERQANTVYYMHAEAANSQASVTHWCTDYEAVLYRLEKFKDRYTDAVGSIVGVRIKTLHLNRDATYRRL